MLVTDLPKDHPARIAFEEAVAKEAERLKERIENDVLASLPIVEIPAQRHRT